MEDNRLAIMACIALLGITVAYYAGMNQGDEDCHDKHVLASGGFMRPSDTRDHTGEPWPPQPETYGPPRLGQATMHDSETQALQTQKIVTSADPAGDVEKFQWICAHDEAICDLAASATAERP